jgi:hypothetical protein
VTSLPSADGYLYLSGYMNFFPEVPLIPS